MTVEEDLSRHFEDQLARHSFSAADTAYNDWLTQRNLPPYVAELAVPSPTRRRRPVALVAAAVLLVGIFVAVWSHGDTRTAVDYGAPIAAPTDPGATVAVTAATDWEGGQTNGWAFQHPPDWTVTSNLNCGSIHIAVLIASKAGIDGCQASGQRSLGNGSVAFAAVLQGFEQPPASDGPSDTISSGLRAGVVEPVYDVPTDQGITKIVAAFSGPYAAVYKLARSVAWSIVAPPTGDDQTYRGPSLASERSLAKVLAASESAVDFPILLPSVVPRNFAASSFDAGGSYVKVDLADMLGSALRKISFCSGGSTEQRTCGSDVDLTVERNYVGQEWLCGDYPHQPGQGMRCRRTAENGDWVGFHVGTGSFSTAELDAMLGSLTTDLSGADWAQ